MPELSFCSRLARVFIAALIAAMLCAAVSAQAPSRPVKYDSGTISGLTARNIGSATMSGRIAAIDAVDENGKITMFVGSASGGVWKTINGGDYFPPPLFPTDISTSWRLTDPPFE